MKEILIFALFAALCIGDADAAVRDGTTATTRSSGTTQQRISTTSKTDRTTTARTTVLKPASNSTTRASGTTKTTTTTQSAASRATTTRAAATSAAASRQTTARTATGTTVSPRASSTTATDARQQSAIISRAATSEATTMSETRTGAEYEKCKNAYFTCMDQFCQLKNDDYRRCSCSDRVYELTELLEVLQQAGEKLTVFTENIDVVGMTAAQATAMRTASEGENALTSDTSASKALLQAIMNSIRGGDTTVGGKYSDLNSINLSFDTTNAFGTTDSGQIIATYNGQNLYNAVYPQCRQAVMADCNDASLQRAITAYLMAVEQDCNTVQTAIETKQKEMKSAVREGSAMLDLARVENRQKHNSDDIATCINNVESAILSEEVCGAGYHRCLDNGEFIDISTGAPIAGVVKFYELENLLTFSAGVDAADQKLSKLNSNKTFVTNFEKRVKKFAQPALDKCTEQADTVWEEYLDKAMLDIYYAQKSKVSEIKQGCFDFVSSCYVNSEASLTAAMKELIGDSSIVLQPDKVALNTQLCKDYVESCNNMFDGNIVAEYIDTRQTTDTLAACRAVAKQCFDNFGGTSYENFYYPYSGLFYTGAAPDWFTLYEISTSSDGADIDLGNGFYGTYKSECAKQLKEIDACSSQEMLEQAFGGFDSIKASKGYYNQNTVYYSDNDSKSVKYGILNSTTTSGIEKPNNGGTLDTTVYTLQHRTLRPTGVATEIYNQIVDILSTQCINLQGRFVETQFIKEGLYQEDNFCVSSFDDTLAYGGDANGGQPNLVELFGIGQGENMCPRDYSLSVDTQSWGACLCWENGGRRSKWGKSAKCVSALPVPATTTDGTTTSADDAQCTDSTGKYIYTTVEKTTAKTAIEDWCTQTIMSDDYRICPLGGTKAESGDCQDSSNTILKNIPEAIN